MQELIHTLDSKTATADGAAISLDGARKVSFIFKRSGHDSGSSEFSVDVSHDGSNWVDYAKLIDNTADTNSESRTRVSSKTLSSDTSVYLSMSPEDTACYVRVSVVETTDGTHDAWVMIDR